MPQMSPSLWLLIMTILTMMYLMLMFKLYFINTNFKFINKFNYNNLLINKLNMKLKW